MLRTMMKSKIHRARVTRADLHYVGSVTIDTTLLKAAGLRAGEQVDIVDIDNGNRLTTYVIEGAADSGVIGINGAAARLVNPGDMVIIIGYGIFSEDELADYKPDVVFVDHENRPKSVGHDPCEFDDDPDLFRDDAKGSFGLH